MPQPQSPSAEKATTVWHMASWIQSLGVHELVAECLQPPAGVEHFDFAKGLTSEACAADMRNGGLVEKLAAALASGAAALQQQGAATASELNDKFAGDAFKGEMRVASLDTFYKGLGGLIGEPLMVEGSLLKGMEAEHRERSDSTKQFLRSMSKPNKPKCAKCRSQAWVANCQRIDKL